MPESATASRDEAPMAVPVHTSVAKINWDKVGDEIHCPLCGYNLRGLDEPRCPECGSRYQWSDLFDPSRRRHPFLYEHHPESGFSAFWKTLAAGLRPRRFWRGLHPVQPCHGGRLFRYACLTIGVQLLVLIVAHLAWTYQRLTATTIWWAWGQPPQPGPSFSAVLAKSLAWLDVRHLLDGSWAPLLLLLWPVLTCLTLFIFQISMRRAKLRSVHVLRTVVYSFDLLLWFAAPLLFVDGLRALLVERVVFQRSTAEMFGLGQFCIVLACLLLAAYRLVTAYWHYLQFDRPVWTILASQFICVLIVLNAAVLAAIW